MTCSPAGEDDGLRALPGLPSDAGDVREVRSPLPAVQAVLPELAHADALRINTFCFAFLCRGHKISNMRANQAHAAGVAS